MDEGVVKVGDSGRDFVEKVTFLLSSHLCSFVWDPSAVLG